MKMEDLPLSLLHEVRDKVDHLNTGFLEFKNKVVTKDELFLWRETQKTTRRWAIGTMIALAMLLISFAAIIIQTRPG